MPPGIVLRLVGPQHRRADPVEVAAGRPRLGLGGGESACCQSLPLADIRFPRARRSPPVRLAMARRPASAGLRPKPSASTNVPPDALEVDLARQGDVARSRPAGSRRVSRLLPRQVLPAVGGADEPGRRAQPGRRAGQGQREAVALGEEHRGRPCSRRPRPCCRCPGCPDGGRAARTGGSRPSVPLQRREARPLQHDVASRVGEDRPSRSDSAPCRQVLVSRYAGTPSARARRSRAGRAASPRRRTSRPSVTMNPRSRVQA